MSRFAYVIAKQRGREIVDALVATEYPVTLTHRDYAVTQHLVATTQGRDVAEAMARAYDLATSEHPELVAYPSLRAQMSDMLQMLEYAESVDMMSRLREHLGAAVKG